MIFLHFVTVIGNWFLLLVFLLFKTRITRIPKKANKINAVRVDTYVL